MSFRGDMVFQPELPIDCTVQECFIKQLVSPANAASQVPVNGYRFAGGGNGGMESLAVGNAGSLSHSKHQNSL